LLTFVPPFQPQPENKNELHGFVQLKNKNGPIFPEISPKPVANFVDFCLRQTYNER